MPGGSARLRVADRTALAVLCLLLIASVAARIYASATSNAAQVAVPDAVDLGQGVFLPHGATARRLVRVAACADPITAEFVRPLQRGGDAFPASSPGPIDHVFYVYRDWTLDGPYADLKLGVLHLVARAGAVLRLNEAVARDALAVKIVRPADCNASPDAVMTALRLDVRSGTGPGRVD